jgi:hypothetical protein
VAGSLPFPVICCGSATDSSCWTYHQYEIEGRDLRTQRRVFRPTTGHFEASDSQDVKLP